MRLLEPDWKMIRKAVREFLIGMGFDAETAETIGETGINDLKTSIDKLIDCFQEGNMDCVASVSHAIKGILYNMGLTEKGDKFKKIQLAILNESDAEEIERLIEEAVNFLHR